MEPPFFAKNNECSTDSSPVLQEGVRQRAIALQKTSGL
jgi:hypothetical protein